MTMRAGEWICDGCGKKTRQATAGLLGKLSYPAHWTFLHSTQNGKARDWDACSWMCVGRIAKREYERTYSAA